MVQLTSELKNLRLSLVNIQPCLVSAFQLLLSGHSTLVRESISIAARRVRFDVGVDSTQHSTCCSPLMQKITQVQIVNSSLSGASIRAQPAPALSWPHLRFLHHSLICSPLNSWFSFRLLTWCLSFAQHTLCHVRISLFWIVSSKILAVLDVSVCACTLFSGYQRFQQAVLNLPSTRLLACVVHPLTLQVPSCSDASGLLLPRTSDHDPMQKYLIQTIQPLGLHTC